MQEKFEKGTYEFFMSSKLPMSDDEIWYWYTACIAQRESNMPLPQWCKANSVDYKYMSNVRQRMEGKKYTNPAYYKKLMEHVGELNASGMVPRHYCKENKLNKLHLEAARTHWKYLQRIEYIKTERERNNLEMHFINIPVKKDIKTLKTSEPKLSFSTPQVIEASNDIELMITQGIKVIISPSIDATKIIKIIDLLRNL